MSRRTPPRAASLVAAVAAAAALAAAPGCVGNTEAPAMRLSGVAPVAGADDVPVQLYINGDHFLPQVRTDFSKPASSAVAGQFRVSLTRSDVAASPAIELGEATYRTSQQLQVTVPPGIARGFYSVTVVDPRGHSATLSEVYRVVSARHNVASFTVQHLDEQRTGVPFLLQITAVDAQGQTVDGFDGTVTITDTTRSLTPTPSGAFALGRVRLMVTVGMPQPKDVVSVADAEGHTGSSDPFDVIAGLAVQLSFAGLGPALTAGKPPTDPIRLQLVDAKQNPAPAADDLVVQLAAAPPDRFRFCAAAACDEPSVVDRVTITAGTDDAQFWVLGEVAGAVTLRAQPLSLPGATLALTVVADMVDRVAFTSPSQRLAPGSCSPKAVQLESTDANGNAQPVDAPTTVKLSVAPVGANGLPPLSFFSNVDCLGTAITSVELTPAAAGTVFYLRADAEGTSTVTAEPQPSSPGATALNSARLVFSVTTP